MAPLATATIALAMAGSNTHCTSPLLPVRFCTAVAHHAICVVKARPAMAALPAGNWPVTIRATVPGFTGPPTAATGLVALRKGMAMLANWANLACTCATACTGVTSAGCGVVAVVAVLFAFATVAVAILFAFRAGFALACACPYTCYYTALQVQLQGFYTP